MYINPETNIRILKNVPLDNTYKDTLYFASESAQHTYFMGKAKYNLTNYSYQRVQRGWIRVGVRAENLYDCNYLMFQNSAFGTKWFYAFIVSVEYVNNECSQVQFEIDVMQTWYFDYTLQRCLVERQHVADDTIYKHYEPEGLDTGEMVSVGTRHTPSALSGSMRCVMAVPKPTNFNEDEMFIWRYNGMPSGALYLEAENNESSITDMLEALESQDLNAIISLYMMPKEYVPAPTGSAWGNGHMISETGGPTQIEFNGIGIKPTSFGGYVPRNNRLYSSPFTVLQFSDNTENKAFYKPELFSSASTGVVSFTSRGVFIGAPELLIMPNGYKGSTIGFDDAFVISDFPQCATPSDSYKAYIAQKGFTTWSTPLIGALTSLVGGNPGGVANIANNVIDQNVQAMNKSNTTRSKDASGVIGCNGKIPYYVLKGVSSYYAKMIDDYLTVYGYAINDMKLPNVHARSEYTYIKTRDCSATGSVPVDDMRKIKSNYDNGITFWVNASHVGNYNRTNTPLNNE